MKKTLLSVIVLLSVLLSVLPQTASAGAMPFSDVKAGEWYYDSVAAVYEKGVMIGMSESEFSPSSPMTRAQLVTVVCRLSGDDPAGLGEDIAFLDALPDDWYADYIGWAVRENVVVGYPDGTFGPDEPVTRSEAAVILERFFGGREIYFSGSALTDSFSDADAIEEWAKGSVEELRIRGVVSGDAKGNFNGSSPATRAEIAEMTARYLDSKPLSKVDYYMSHILDYAPHSGKFLTLELSIAKWVNAEKIGAQILPCFGLSEDEYEIVADDEEIADLRDVWTRHDYGDTVMAFLTLALKDKSTGETSQPSYVRCKIKKVEVYIYVDPDDFDPGFDPDIYSAMIDASLPYSGNTARLYRALRRGADGEGLTVAFIGGSITAGSTAIPGGGYANIAANWLERHVTSDVKPVYAGIGGTPSYFGNARLGRDVLSHDPDIVFVEFAVNDYPGEDKPHVRESYESLIRTVLNREDAPAVVIVLVRGGEANFPFMNSVAERYEIPVVNVSAGGQYAIDAGVLTDEEFMPDTVHPDDLGHQIMSDMIEELFRRTLDDYASVSEAEAAIAPVTGETVTPSRLENLTMIEAEDLDIVSMGSFRFTGTDYGLGFTRAATSKPSDGREPIVFRITAKSVELVLDSGTEVWITVDGGEPIRSGCVAYMADCGPVVLSDVEAEHTITVTPRDDSEVKLLAVVYN